MQENATQEDVLIEKPATAEPETPQEPGFHINNGIDSFVFMDATTKALQVALATGQNLILFGKGGYGKSEYTIEFLKQMNIHPYVMTMGTGTTTEKLFGGFDIKTFNDTGKMEYLVENSFMNHEFVVFEELFDAPDFILEQLKDILSAGVFRNGSQIYPIKTQLIICCTNKTREEFAKNNSLKALMERFPLEHNVKWNEHTRAAYALLLSKKLGHADPLLTYVLEQYSTANQTISPRIAIAAAEVLATCGLECLQYIADFASKPEILSDSLKKFEGIIKFDKIRKDIEQDTKHARSIVELDPNTAMAAQIGNVKRATLRLTTALSELENLTVEDAQVAAKAQLVKDTKKLVNDTKAALELF